MEDSPSPECIVAVRCRNDWDSVCDDIRVDEEWDHQRVSEARGCKPVAARKSFCSKYSSSLVIDGHTTAVARRRR